jgi:hypothetical protein
VASLLVLGGCGGGSSSSSQTTQTTSFKTAFASAVDELKKTSQSIGTEIEHASSQTDAQIASKFSDLATRWQTGLTQLQGLKPPSDLSSTYNKLTEAATRAETDLKAIVVAANSHSATAAATASKSLVTDVVSAKSESTTITNKLGIK